MPSAKVKSLLGLLLGVITLALYLPSLRNHFLDYDDQQYVTENPHIRAGLTLKGLVWAFGYHASNWHPLTWVSHMLDCQLYGLHPAGHHLTNVLLHTATTILFFLVFCRMTGAVWRSLFVAALFGWHPLHVESVAWVAERKDVLCAFFFMLTVGTYARYVSSVECRGAEKSEIRNTKSEGNPKIWYSLTLFFFVLALMSKPMAVTLPFVLLLLDYWPLRRIQLPVTNYRLLLRLLLEKIPFLVLAGVACVLTIIAQNRAYAVVSTAGLAISTRIAHAPLSYMHYIGAMFLPRHLSVYYPYQTALPGAQVVAAGLVLVLVTLISFWFGRRRPYFLVGWLWFLGMLVPVIGLIQVGDQAWADRYTYLPLIGLFIAVVWGIGDAFQNLGLSQIPAGGAVRTPRPTTPCVVPIGIGVAMVALTSFQLRYWKDTRTLFEHAAAVTRNNYMAVTLLGSLSAKDGKLDDAINCYKTALNWKRDYPEVHFFLGNALDQQGKLDQAIDEYKQALWSKPMQEQTHIFLGVALAKKQQLQEAAAHYHAALQLNPESAVAHNNLARLLQTQGLLDEAMEHYSAALRFDPGLAQAHNNLGVVMLMRGKTTEGARELHEALRLNPGDPETEYNLAMALNQQRDWSHAAELLANTVQKRPNDANAHYQIAVALAHLQKTREAMSHYASALLIQPDFADALDGLAWILVTNSDPDLRNGKEALPMSEKACELTGRKDAEKLKTLAAVYAENGRFEDALSAIQSAWNAGSQHGRTNFMAECESMRRTFSSRQTWREPRGR